MLPFSGEKIKWNEFWDSFESAVHKNKKLSNIEKFNYLKGKLTGDALNAIAGLSLSNENYEVAVSILKERFGKKQDLVDIHYMQVINLPPARTRTSSLRSLLNNIEKHIRCLAVLKQNVEQDIFVAMIRAKLQEEVLVQLDMLNGAKNTWTVQKLRDRLDDYITARENAEPKVTDNLKVSNNKVQQSYSEAKTKVSSLFPARQVGKYSGGPHNVGSAEALLVNAKQVQAQRRFYISVGIVMNVIRVTNVIISKQ